MIGYLEGVLLKKEDDRILLLANQVGYEVLLPSVIMGTIESKDVGDEISLYIYYHQTERQPKPVLIGFNLEAEKEFFQHFISVEAIGPLKAVKAMSCPVCDIARAIETKDAGELQQLNGIGKRTAQKIIATLEGKVNKFALIRKDEKIKAVYTGDFVDKVFNVLVTQLGHKSTDARQLIEDALEQNSSISTPEALFDEVYKGQTG